MARLRPSKTGLGVDQLHTEWPFSGRPQQLEIHLPKLSSFLEDQADNAPAYRVPEKDIVKLHRFRFGKRVFIFLFCMA